MKKLSANGLRVLKATHLFFAILWIGSAICLNLLRHLIHVDDAAGMYYMAEILNAIDFKILVPGVVGCILTGIAYGVWTNFGFFKFRWITAKWILTIIMFCIGTFCMGPLIKANVVIGKALIQGAGDTGQYAANVAQSSLFGGLQLLMLFMVLLLSVWKPWKKKNRKPEVKQ